MPASVGGTRRAAAPPLQPRPLEDPRVLELLEARVSVFGGMPMIVRLNRCSGIAPPGRRRRSRAPSAARGGPPHGRPPRAGLSGVTRRLHGELPLGSRASSSTSPSVITGWKDSSSRTSAARRRGLPCSARGRSRPAARQRAPRAPSASRPPIGSTRPWSDLARHPDGVLHGPPGEERRERGEIAMPALGPSFGIAPAGTCTWNVVSYAGLVDPDLRRVRWM